MQFGVGDTTRWFYLTFDILIVTVVITVFLRIFKSQRTVGYLALIGPVFIALVASAYLTLPGLHLLSQASLVLLIVGLPVFMGDEWRQIFGDKSQPISAMPPYFNPFTAGMIALVSALLIVGIASGVGGKTAELPQGIPLTAVNLPDGMAASFGRTVSAKVIVSAPSSTWRSLTADNFSAIIDVAKQAEGTYNLPVTVTTKIPNVTIVRIQPPSVTVTVEPIIKKTVPVVAVFSGKAGSDLVPDDPVINPDKVEASGPKSVLADLTQAVIQVHLNGETQVIVQKFTLVALTTDGQIIGSISFNPPVVETTIGLVKAGKLKTVGIRPMLTGQPQTGYWVKNVSLDPFAVSVTGSADALSSLQEITTQPITVTGLTADSVLSTTLNLPSGITVADKTTKITVSLKLDTVATTKIVLPEIQPDGLSASLKITSFTPASVSLLVSGSSLVLSGLADSNFKLKIDLSAFKSAGTYSITIKDTDLTLPSGIGLVSYLPSAINVTLDNK